MLHTRIIMLLCNEATKHVPGIGAGGKKIKEGKIGKSTL